MNEITLLREVGPEAPDLTAAARSAARATLLDEIGSSRPAGGRSRMLPSRKATAARIGIAVVVVAAAWTTAVAVAPPDRAGTPAEPTAAQPDPSSGGIALVAAQQITFPLSLDPVPEDLTASFSRTAVTDSSGHESVVFLADYWSTDGDRFVLWVYPEDPRGAADYERPQDRRDFAEAGTVTVDGTEAVLATGHDGSFTDLLWERSDDQWVRIQGGGTYGDGAAVVAVAESIVDRPQAAGLQFGLAPAGWSLSNYEESQTLELVNGDDPQQRLHLSLIQRRSGVTLDTAFDGMALAGQVEPVTVNGQPARLVLGDGGPGSPDSWHVVGDLSNGQLFLLLAPETLARADVLEIAGHITYTP